MIPKISRRADGNMTGLMRYLVGPGRSNEHENPRIVAGSPALMAWYSDMELTVPDAERIAEHLEHPQKVYGTQVYGGNTWHCSLSIKAEEGVLPDERWAQIGQRFMEHMGFLDGAKAPVRWAFVRHGLSSGRDGQPGNDHGHLAVELVREDGTKASTWNDRPRAQAACAALEREFGLQVVESRTVHRGERGVSRAELERAAKFQLPEPERRTLARIVLGAAVASADEAEFVRRLRAARVLVRPYFAKGGTEAVSGYAVAARPPRGEKAIYLGGGLLGKDMTLPRLRASQGWQAGGTRAAVAEWTAARDRRPPVAPGAEQARLDPALERAFAAEVQALQARIAAVPVEDTATWAGLARQVGGTFAAWSWAAERDRPGPLAQAADRLAEAGRLPAWADHPSVEVPPLRNAARLLALSSGGPRAEYALMLRVLTNAAKAVHDQAQAVGELQRAQHIEAVMVGRLAGLPQQRQVQSPTAARRAPARTLTREREIER